MPLYHEQSLCIAAFALSQRLRPINARIIHIPNGGARGSNRKNSLIIGKRIKDMGGVAGVFDYLILFDNGTFAMLEAKLKTKKLRGNIVHRKTNLNPAQKKFKSEMVELCGDSFRFAEFRTVNEFIERLTELGVRWKLKRKNGF